MDSSRNAARALTADTVICFNLKDGGEKKNGEN